MVSVTRDVLKAISDEKSVELFRIVAITNPYTDPADILKCKTKLTHKQYYSRMSKLIKAGLIKRKNGKNSLTALGKIIYNAQMKIENAINNYWKLKAIDSLEQSEEHYTEEERKKQIDNLIDNYEIKDILLSNIGNNKFESERPLIDIDIELQKEMR
jgi:hypothetical protein